MKNHQQIIKMLMEVENDERLSYPPANVEVNAPLALIQVALANRRAVLREILEISRPVGSEGYWVMDGRALHEVDSAYVLCTCGTLEEAKRDINKYGSDSCIVDVANQMVVDSLLWRDKPYGTSSPKKKKERKMSQGSACRCLESKKPVTDRSWRVIESKCNHSAFNGYHYTPSDYSSVLCTACGSVWRTKAKYVDLLPDQKEEEMPAPKADPVIEPKFVPGQGVHYTNANDVYIGIKIVKSSVWDEDLNMYRYYIEPTDTPWFAVKESQLRAMGEKDG